MKIFQVLRFDHSSFDTVGMLFELDGNLRTFLCFTLEDPPQPKKIHGRTRIPAGTYEVTLREEGGFHAKYSKKFPDMHQGMVWIRNIPNYEYVLMHIGNTHRDTEGCLLTGLGLKRIPDRAGELLQSTDAYRLVYPIVRDAILTGPTYFQYVDFA